MKKITLSLLSVVALTGVVSSCAPKLAEQAIDPSDAAWNQYVQKAYPSWTPPPPPPPYSPAPQNQLVGLYPHQGGTAMQPNNQFSQIPEEPVVETLILPNNQPEAVIEETIIATPIVAPVVTATPVSSTSTMVYVVRPGDSAWKIAAKVYGNGKYMQKILDANPKFKTKKVLFVGAKLNIPEIPGVKMNMSVFESAQKIVPAEKVVPAKKMVPVSEPSVDTANVVAPIVAPVVPPAPVLSEGIVEMVEIDSTVKL